MNEDTLDFLIYFGGAVKVLAEDDDTVTIGGPAVIFDAEDSDDADLENEFFAGDTYFGAASKSGEWEVDGMFHHGFPISSNDAAKALASHEFPPVKLTKEDQDLLGQIVLDKRNEYEQMVADWARKGLLGWSTGSAPHAVKRAKLDDGRTKITRWPIVECSLTHTPAEPRTAAMPLKSILKDLKTPAATKAESLTAKLDRIYRAFYDQFDGRGYVVEIFEADAVVEMGGSYYRAAYSVTDEEVKFADSPTWEKVKRKSEWIPAKAIYSAFLNLPTEEKSSSEEDDLLEILADLNNHLTKS